MYFDICCLSNRFYTPAFQLHGFTLPLKRQINKQKGPKHQRNKKVKKAKKTPHKIIAMTRSTHTHGVHFVLVRYF